eukprot:7383749-Pyramimonas_sp.AAC.1
MAAAPPRPRSTPPAPAHIPSVARRVRALQPFSAFVSLYAAYTKYVDKEFGNELPTVDNYEEMHVTTSNVSVALLFAMEKNIPEKNG